MSDTDDDDLFVPTTSSNKPTSKLLVLGGDDDDADPMATMGVKQQTDVEIRIRPWMKYHESILIETVGELEKLVDLCIAKGRASLDLETTGLDNRVYFHDPATLDSTHERWWDESNPPAKVPVTVHKVVGYCISPDGRTGYYAPIRHTAEKSNNLDPVGAGRAIQRLCQAAQPEINPEGLVEDPLGSTNIKTLGKVKLLFWYAKFDQEFLYPITGIDWWHPESFEDGMLMYFTKLSNDKSLGLKDKSKRKLVVHDENGKPVFENGSEVPYEMVELKECFAPGRSISFPELDPREALPYTSGDSICTFLHCTKPDVCDVLTDKKFAQTYRLEKQVTQVTRIMERNRIRIDRKYVTDLLAEAEKEALVYREEIVALAVQLGFNNFDPQSPKQLSEFLFASPNGLRIEPKPEQNEKSGQYKTDADTFEKLVEENPNINPILITVVKYRQVEKVVGTYLKSMHNNTDKYGDLRYQFRQVGAATGRFSAPAGDPEHGYGGVPVHGIPSTYDDKKPKVATALRKAFIARPGYAILKVDYAGEELRIITNLSKEPVWEKEFCEGTGDLHSITARAFFGKTEISKQERQMGKCVDPSTLVFTGGVLKALSDLGSYPDVDTFSDVSGLSVHDQRGPQPLTALYNGGTKPLVHVVTSGGLLTCTEEHRFSMRDGSLCRAGDLTEGLQLQPVSIPLMVDRPYQDAKFSVWGGIPESTYKLSHDLSYFAGLFAGDGSMCKSSARLTHGNPKKVDHYGSSYNEWVEHLEQSARACGLEPVRHGKDTVYLGSIVVIRFLQALGLSTKRSKVLRVPNWVLAAGRTSCLHYLGGLFDTDGTVGRDSHNLDLTTKDFTFAGQLSTVLRSCGLDFNPELTFNKTYGRYYVRLRLTVACSWEMRRYLRHQGKLSRLRAPEQLGRVKDRFEVVKVLPAGSGPCVDVTVGTEDHLYLSNGILTHNSANFSLVYGGGVNAIMRSTGCNQIEAARRKSNFDKSMPVFAGWVAKQKKKVHMEKGVFTAFGRWIAIPEIDNENKAIQAGGERFSTNYPIQGSAADLMKVAMIRLHKIFYLRGWFQNDTVRMMLTVHDELVFEIKFEAIMEVVPVIEAAMAMKDLTDKLKWKVPLVMEPLIDLTWDAKYDFSKMVHGEHKPEKPGDKPLKSGEVRVGDRVYQRVPDIFAGYIIPDWDSGSVPPVPPSKPPSDSAPPSTPVASIAVQSEERASTASVVSQPVERAPVAAPVATPAAKSNQPFFQTWISVLSPQSIGQVWEAVHHAWPDDSDTGKLVKLLDTLSGSVLIDPEETPILVKEGKFNDRIRSLNL